MTTIVFQSLLVACVLALTIAVPVPVKKPVEEKIEEKGDPGYIRYLRQVIDILEEDEDYAKRLLNATEEEIREGHIANDLDFVNHHVRTKLDELKRREIENQRAVHRKMQDQLNGIGSRDNWHPVFDENQETFEIDDFKKLLNKHNEELIKQDEERRKEFKQYELEKEHESRENMRKMDEEARKKEEERLNAIKQQHIEASKSVHHPGSKAQLEEVWEEKDGLEADNFDPRTFFKLHDTNTDGYLDPFELEALFMNEVGKIYNETANDFDPRERDEELARMREHVLKEIDADKDGFVSQEEFMKATQTPEYEKDDGWKTVEEEPKFSEDEFEEYEKMMREEQERQHQATQGEQQDHHENQQQEHDSQQQQQTEQHEEKQPIEH